MMLTFGEVYIDNPQLFLQQVRLSFSSFEDLCQRIIVSCAKEVHLLCFISSFIFFFTLIFVIFVILALILNLLSSHLAHVSF